MTKTLLLASALSLLAGPALAGQAPVLLQDGGDSTYDYTHRAPQRSVSEVPAASASVVEGRQAYTVPRLFANQPVLVQDGGDTSYDYTHRAPQRSVSKASNASAPLVEGRQALEARAGTGRQMIIEYDNSVGANGGKVIRWY